MKRQENYLNKKHKKTSAAKKHCDFLKLVCWIVIPVTAATLLVLDALGFYAFNTERLIVLGVCLIVVLLPFFSEITIKDLSVKRGKDKNSK